MIKRERRKTILGPAMALLTVLLLGAAVFFLDSDPEHRVVLSDDNEVRLEGNLPVGLEVTITKDEEASAQPWTAVRSGVYRIDPEGVRLPEVVALRFPLPVTADSAGGFAVGYFDATRGVWVPLDSEGDSLNRTVEAKTDHFSYWALLANARVQVSERDRDALIRQALASVPIGAQSYRVDLGYERVEGDVVLFDEAAAQGSCDEVATVREERLQTRTTLPASVTIDNMQTDVTLHAIVDWGVGAGCVNLTKQL